MNTLDEIKIVNCGCGGEARLLHHVGHGYYVRCRDCFTRTDFKVTESEAISVWNRAMGNRMELQTIKEQTAKVIMHKYWLGVSLNVVGEQTIGHEWICENCKKMVLDGDDYCSHCGAKLEWNHE